MSTDTELAAAPPSRLNLLPGFRQPRTRTPDPEWPEGPETTPEQDPLGPTPASPADPGYPGGQASLSLDADTRTATSASRTDAKKLTPQLAVGLLGIAFAIGAWAVSSARPRHRLREPGKAELREMGEPIGRILARHVPVDWLNADLVDATQAAAAVGNYLSDGPLLVARKPDPGQLATQEEMS